MKALSTEKKEAKNTVVNISVWLSATAILICIGGLIYEYISKNNSYWVWGLLLLSNLTIMLANISNKNNKKSDK